MKKLYYSLFLFLPVFIFNSCKNTADPVNTDGPRSHLVVMIPINPDSLKPDETHKFSTSYSELKLNGVFLSEVKYYYPVQDNNISIDKEFIISVNDSFIVEINNCDSKYDWKVDPGNTSSDPKYGWINMEVSLVRTDRIPNADGTVNYSFVFKALKKGKGYISFIESQSGMVSSDKSHGLMIGYTINPLDKIVLNISKTEWIYNTEPGSFSRVSVKISGTTNVYRLRGMTYGDGVPRAMEIPIQNNGSFEAEIPVAFSHVEGVTLTGNTELLLYGTVGLPKVFPLINPKSQSDK